VDDFEQYLDDEGPDEYGEAVDAEIAERAPGLASEARDELAGRLELGRHVEVVQDGDEDTPGIAFKLTEAGEVLVCRATRWRDPAPKEPPRVRLRTDCRPLRSGRRVRRHPTRSRAGPSSDDPDPEPPHNQRVAQAMGRVAR
jgi:hypothetical protein